MAPAASKSKSKKKDLTADDHAAIRRDHHRGGMSIEEIRQKWNLSRATVSNIINFRGPYRE